VFSYVIFIPSFVHIIQMVKILRDEFGNMDLCLDSTIMQVSFVLCNKASTVLAQTKDKVSIHASFLEKKEVAFFLGPYE
jgi:hypothetical protein